MATRVTVNSKNIQFAHTPGGDIQKKTMQVMRNAKLKAVLGAPARSGELRRSHRIYAPPGGIYGVTGVLANSAPHARYVKDGTTGPITAKKTWLLVPITPGTSSPRHLRRSVRGQAANNWMGRALDAAVREA